MLNKYKNLFLETILKLGLDPTEVTIEDSDAIFTVKIDNTPFKFIVYAFTLHDFNYKCTYFDRNFPFVQHPGNFSINKLLEGFEAWYSQHVKPYFEEISTPNLWENIEAQKALLADTEFEKEDYAYFTADEKEQIRLCINEFKISIINNFHPSELEIRVIDARLKYLSAAVDRLNKFDWRSLLINTVLNLSLALALEPEKSKWLFNIFKQAFAQLTKLLTS